MTIDSQRAAELAAKLNPAAQLTDARTRLLCIADLLARITDEEHPLSNADIRAVLEARFGPAAAAAENTINSDIKALKTSNCLGLEVHTGPRGTWARRSGLTPADIRLVLNAVQSSRLLTDEQGARLQNGLLNLVSYYQEDDLFADVHVDQREHVDGSNIFAVCNTISKAIRQGKMVEFEYAFNDFLGNSHALDSDPAYYENLVELEEQSGALTPSAREKLHTLRVETPTALIFSDNKYYLESYSDPAWRHGFKIVHSRVDRMQNVHVSERDAVHAREVYNARRSIRRRMSEGFEMMLGQSRTVFLLVRADKTNEMFDRFGLTLAYEQFTGQIGDVETTAITWVRVAQTGTFFRWLTGAGGGIRLVRPVDELWVQTGSWRKMVKEEAAKLADSGDERTVFEKLTDDYEAMAASYRAYLERAAGAVE